MNYLVRLMYLKMLSRSKMTRELSNTLIDLERKKYIEIHIEEDKLG